MTIELTTLLAVGGVIIIPGLIAWIALREKVVRLEERVKMHEDGANKLDSKLDRIFAELKDLRDEIHNKNQLK